MYQHTPTEGTGATLTVDLNGGADHTDIQSAIDAAAYGDTVLVKAGQCGIDPSEDTLDCASFPPCRWIPQSHEVTARACPQQGQAGSPSVHLPLIPHRSWHPISATSQGGAARETRPSRPPHGPDVEVAGLPELEDCATVPETDGPGVGRGNDERRR